MMLQVSSRRRNGSALCAGERVIAPITSGTFDVATARKVLRAAVTGPVAVRGVLELDLRSRSRRRWALIGMTSSASAWPAEVLAALARGESVDPSTYYPDRFPGSKRARAAVEFLNRLIAIASGDRRANGPIYTRRDPLVMLIGRRECSRQSLDSSWPIRAGCLPEQPAFSHPNERKTQ